MSKKNSLYKTQVLPNLANGYINQLARSGLTQYQIADAIKISHPTMDRYLRVHQDLREAVTTGREVAIVELENALFKKATGYKETVHKGMKVKKVVYENGRKKGEVETVEPYEEEVVFAPDTGAAIFLLKNWAKEKKYSNEPELMAARKRELDIKEKMMENGDSEEDKVIIINDLHGDS